MYSTLIPQDWVWQETKATSLVIAAETSAPVMCLQPESMYSQTVGAASAHYSQLIQRKWKLQRNLKIDKPYELVLQDKINGFFGKGKGGWNPYYKAYPNSGGILYLSPVGFTPARDIAVVEVSHGCGFRCGGGSFSVLERETGNGYRFDGAAPRASWHLDRLVYTVGNPAKPIPACRATDRMYVAASPYSSGVFKCSIIKGASAPSRLISVRYRR